MDHIDKLEQRAEVAEANVEWLKGLLIRVLSCEGRCPTRLLIDISAALGTEKGQ